MSRRKKPTISPELREKIKLAVSNVNHDLVWYKKGCILDIKRTPDEVENIIENLTDFVEARFNRECFDIPEFKQACELMDGRLFFCTLVNPDEIKKRYKLAKMSLLDLDDVENPTEELINAINDIKNIIGGTRIEFNSVKLKIKLTIF